MILCFWPQYRRRSVDRNSFTRQQSYGTMNWHTPTATAVPLMGASHVKENQERVCTLPLGACAAKECVC